MVMCVIVAARRSFGSLGFHTLQLLQRNCETIRIRGIEFPKACFDFFDGLFVTGNGIESVQVQEHRSVVRRTGRCQYGNHCEFFVVNVIAVSTAVDDRELRSEIPPVLTSHFGSDDRVKQSIDALAVNLKCPARHIFVLEVLGRRADDRERSFLRHVAAGHRHCRNNASVLLQFLQIHIRQCLAGRLHAIHGAQHQLQITASGRSDDQIVANTALRERTVNSAENHKNQHHQHHAQADAECRQAGCQPSLLNAFPGNCQQIHAACSCRQSSG